MLLIVRYYRLFPSINGVFNRESNLHEGTVGASRLDAPPCSLAGWGDQIPGGMNHAIGGLFI